MTRIYNANFNLAATKNHQRSSSSSGGYPSLESNAVEAARSLQQLSNSRPTNNVPECYYCPPQRPICCSTSQHYHQQKMSNMSFNATGGGHRRTVSASLEMPAAYPYHHQHHQYQHSHHHHSHANVIFSNNQRAQIYHQPHPHHSIQQQQQNLPQHPRYRRARAHTTSGYPPTMLFKQPMSSSPPSHVSYNHNNNDNNNNNNQQTIINNHKNDQMMRETKEATTTTQHHRYHCQHCKKSFSRPSSLRIHIYSHTGEKPFKCHHQGCGRSFSVHSNMRRHLRVHYYQPTFNNTTSLLGQQQHNNSMRLPIVPPPPPPQQQQANICCNTSNSRVAGVAKTSPLLHT